MFDNFSLIYHLVAIEFVKSNGREFPVYEMFQFLKEVRNMEAGNNPFGKNKHPTYWLVENWVIKSDEHGWFWFTDDSFDELMEALKK